MSVDIMTIADTEIEAWRLDDRLTGRQTGRQADKHERPRQRCDCASSRIRSTQHNLPLDERERDNELISNRARPRRPSTGIETRPRMESVRLYITVLLETVPSP
jgi:hypothetical protein